MDIKLNDQKNNKSTKFCNSGDGYGYHYYFGSKSYYFTTRPFYQPCVAYSVVTDKVAWVSGSKGHVAVTKDGGRTWNWQQVRGFESSDFRDVEGFSDKEAVIMSSGTPALILKTLDGGLSWQVKYRNRDTSVFFDAMDFKNKYGCVMGDPINNRFVIFETFDKGNTWRQKDYSKSPMAHYGRSIIRGKRNLFNDQQKRFVAK